MSGGPMVRAGKKRGQESSQRSKARKSTNRTKVGDKKRDQDLSQGSETEKFYREAGTRKPKPETRIVKQDQEHNSRIRKQNQELGAPSGHKDELGPGVFSIASPAAQLPQSVSGFGFLTMRLQSGSTRDPAPRTPFACWSK
ncbi:Hypothetical predicted protein [Pelobates cultripes]|uniref:Uncharacterized protein n=1 Tax=Pelobates cultripes TaxID=61616 RepID=A0AAD1SSK4_PELCU|nr:Hypothetical predicted protein [Pelobates cultripes]